MFHCLHASDNIKWIDTWWLRSGDQQRPHWPKLLPVRMRNPRSRSQSRLMCSTPFSHSPSTNSTSYRLPLLESTVKSKINTWSTWHVMKFQFRIPNVNFHSKKPITLKSSMESPRILNPNRITSFISSCDISRCPTNCHTGNGRLVFRKTSDIGQPETIKGLYVSNLLSGKSELQVSLDRNKAMSIF